MSPGASYPKTYDSRGLGLAWRGIWEARKSWRWRGKAREEARVGRNGAKWWKIRGKGRIYRRGKQYRHKGDSPVQVMWSVLLSGSTSGCKGALPAPWRQKKIGENLKFGCKGIVLLPLCQKQKPYPNRAGARALALGGFLHAQYRLAHLKVFTLRWLEQPWEPHNWSQGYYDCPNTQQTHTLDSTRPNQREKAGHVTSNWGTEANRGEGWTSIYRIIIKPRQECVDQMNPIWVKTEVIQKPP